MLNDTRREGSCLGHVLRSLEHQDAGMVPNVHQWQAINKYVSLPCFLVYYVDLICHLTVYRKSRNSHEHAKAPDPPQQTSEPLKLTDQYIALLILVFTQAGLLDVSISAFHPCFAKVPVKFIVDSRCFIFVCDVGFDVDVPRNDNRI